MPAKLSAALRALIETQVDSFEKLEIIIALRQPTTEGSIAGLAAATNLDRDDVRKLVRELATADLVDQKSDVQIKLVAARSGVLDELAVMYENDKATLVMAIADRAMGRLRNMAGRALAEAFVIRKKPGGSDG